MVEASDTANAGLSRESSVDLDYDQTLNEFKELFKTVSDDLIVNKEQLKDIFDMMGAHVASDDDFARQFDEMDSDKDGVVSYKELEQYLRPSSN